MKEKIKKLNEIKNVYLMTGAFKKESFVNSLKEIGIKMAPSVFKEMLNQEILVKLSKNQYFFKDDKPIYIGTLEQIIKIVRKNKAAEAKKYYYKAKNDNKAEFDNVEFAEIIDSDSEIRRAIALLKQNGYKIYKCITTYEEI